MSSKAPSRQADSQEDWISISHDLLMEILDPCSCLAGSPMSICDLGLVQEVSIGPSSDGAEPATLLVRLALTDPMCMYFIDMAEEIRQAIIGAGWPGIVRVEWDTSVDWSPNMMSQSGQLQIVEVKRQRFAGLQPYKFSSQEGTDSLKYHDA
jgi:metal-sulfur cluster biosynthetic enzyme